MTTSCNLHSETSRLSIAFTARRPRTQVSQRFVCQASLRTGEEEKRHNLPAKIALGLTAVTFSLSASPAFAAFRLPPLDSDPNRCERAFTGNTIGQANAVSDKVLDLRQCKLHGANLSAKVLSGALVADADFSNTTLKEIVLTKAYAVGANFESANLTNAVLDRVDFTRANLKNSNFRNAVITGSVFKDADLTGATFEEALIGGEDAKRLCLNPTLKGDGRVDVGCRK